MSEGELLVAGEGGQLLPQPRRRIYPWDGQARFLATWQRGRVLPQHGLESRLVSPQTTLTDANPVCVGARRLPMPMHAPTFGKYRLSMLVLVAWSGAPQPQFRPAMINVAPVLRCIPLSRLCVTAGIPTGRRWSAVQAGIVLQLTKCWAVEYSREKQPYIRRDHTGRLVHSLPHALFLLLFRSLCLP